MNLHLLDSDPAKIPRLLDNKRIGKMLMETNQMLSLAVKHYMRASDSMDEFMCGESMLTSGWSHYNHPVSIWVRQTSGNFHFALTYAYALGREFLFRFNKEHASSLRTSYIYQLKDWIPEGEVTPFQNSARHESRGLDFTMFEPIEAYRRYMLNRWEYDVRSPEWTGRTDPRISWQGLYK